MRFRAIVSAVCLVAGSVLGGVLLAGPASAAPRSVELTVASFNIHHGAGADDVVDLDRIARVIAATDADVIGVQEVDHHWGTRSDYVAQDEVLASKLGMYYSFAANLDLPPDQPDMPRRQYGTMILSKHPILESRHVLLPRSPDQEQRGLQGVKLDVDGKAAWFYTTHLAASSQTDRLAQTERITRIIQADRAPAVLTGDLNAEPHAPEIKTLERPFNDVWPVVGEGPGFTYSAADPHARIDYAFVSPGNVRPLSAAVYTGEPTASDHLPMMTSLRLS